MTNIGRLIPACVLLLACASEPVAPTPKASELQAEAHHAQTSAAQAPSAQDTQAATSSLTRVDSSLVCMVNNQFMGKAQIPVVVEGKTYFGCCEMCKGRLANDPSSRNAKDPVSGATVDKAAAVIGRDASGGVFYFENEANLQQYAAR